MTVLNATGDFGLDQVLARRLQTPGGSVAPGVAPELFGSITLENDRPEWEYLKGGGLYSRNVAVGAGGAGTRSSLQLINTRPGSLVVVSGVNGLMASGLSVLITGTYALGVLPFGSSQTSGARDTRQRGNATSALISDNTLGVAGGTVIFIGAAAFSFTAPVVLGPGGFLYLAPSADNVAITYAGFNWAERPVNPSEL